MFALTLLLALVFLASGVLRILLAFQVRRVRNWEWLLLSGALSLLLGVLILAGWPPVTNLLTRVLPGTGALVDLVSYFSVMTHFESFQRGVVDSRNVLFFLSVIVFSLFSTGVVIRSLRSN